MIWLTWRQFRSQGAVVGGVLVLLAVVVLVTGLHVLDLYHSCQATKSCGQGTFTSTDRRLQTVLQAMLLIAPALVGIFWGAPLVARELESGTYRLGWTQSVTRGRWLAMKLALVGLASVAVGGLLSLMVSWWFSPIDTVTANVFESFDTRGVAPIGYALFAFALGVTAGVLWRRTLPAMASTLVAFVLFRVAEFEWVRPRLLPTAHTVLPLTMNSPFGLTMTPSGPIFAIGSPNIPNAMVYSGSLVAKAGHESSAMFIKKACAGLLKSLPSPPAAGGGAIHATVQGPGPGGGMQACFDKVAAAYNQSVTYQPASHYWPLQGMETALFVVLSAALLGFSLWWVRHRLS